MGLFRNPAFLAAIAMTAVLSLYFVFVADFAFAFVRSDDLIARGLGAALLILPFVGAWWLFHEWRLGIATQRMASQLEREGRLPLHDGELDAQGRLTEDASQAIFEVARRGVDDKPDDWAAWFHVAHAYEANGDRKMTRASMRHAADLFRAERRRERLGH